MFKSSCNPLVFTFSGLPLFGEFGKRVFPSPPDIWRKLAPPKARKAPQVHRQPVAVSPLGASRRWQARFSRDSSVATWAFAVLFRWFERAHVFACLCRKCQRDHEEACWGRNYLEFFWEFASPLSVVSTTLTFEIWRCLWIDRWW